MKTMKTLKVYEWLVNKGRATGATKLLVLFEGIEDLDYPGLEAFLKIIYRKDSEAIFREMQCDVVTTLNFTLLWKRFRWLSKKDGLPQGTESISQKNLIAEKKNMGENRLENPPPSKKKFEAKVLLRPLFRRYFKARPLILLSFPLKIGNNLHIYNYFTNFF